MFISLEAKTFYSYSKNIVPAAHTSVHDHQSAHGRYHKERSKKAVT